MATIKETYGVPVESIVEGIRHGVRKVNIDTDIRLAMTGAMRRAMAQDPGEFDPRKFLKDATAAARDLCKERFAGVRLRRAGAAHQAGAAREDGGALRLRSDPRLPRAARFLDNCGLFRP